MILDRLVDNSTYDKRLRPMFGLEAVRVGITIHVSSISSISEVNMDFTIDIYLRQTWNDPRLVFGGESDEIGRHINSLTVGVDYLDKLWKPDTFFPNEKKSYFHLATAHNSFLRIEPNGNVVTSQRLTITAICPMKLQLFPMDSQQCKLEIESYGHNVLDIIYYFKTNDSNYRFDFELPQFVLVDVQYASRMESRSSGNYSRLVCLFLFRRNIGFYVIQIYLPSVLIVVISWVSFWLSRDATPARVALGVLTVLTMTTLTTTTNATMPKVSYVKSIDIFLGVSFLMVFGSLIEYAAVGYISRRNQVAKDRWKQQTNALEQSEMIATPSATDKNATTLRRTLPFFANRLYQPFYSSRDENSHLYNGGYVKLPVKLKENLSIFKEERQCLIISAREQQQPSDIESNFKSFFVRPSDIDKYSRSIFPFVFIVFNLIYWIYYYNINGFEISPEYNT